jgi:hypothetical protein
MLLVAGALAACGSSSSEAGSPSTSSGRVLLVGTFDGHDGRYRTIQAAVDAARPGDDILVAPGDYHETADTGTAASAAHAGDFGGVLVSTPHLLIRGMDRATVVVDGTKAGSSRCSSAPADQDFGPRSGDGKALGRNGIVIWKADGVAVQNLTVCNFLAGPEGASGNEIWWNGGADSGTIGMTGYAGSYLTATSTYFGGESTAAQYGIFSSNTRGPGRWDQVYASNFNDSGAYVGACQQVCDMTLDHGWFEYDALGYSGTNSGGAIVIENSLFEHNEDGFDTNTQIAGDPPAPQNGACPHGGTSPITHTHSCWVFWHNVSRDNNNPDVPQAGGAAAGPVGTGMTLSGGRNDTVMDNTFAGNGAWGILFIPFPDSNPPEHHQSCTGTGGVEMKGFGCVYDPMNDALLHNRFVHNGYFGNPANADFGQVVANAGQPQNCYAGNVAPQGSAPPDLEKAQPVCGPLTTAANTGGPLLGQVLCDTGIGSCPAGAAYPQPTKVLMHPLPAHLKSMPNPCRGLPANAWCRDGHPL